MTTIDFKAEVEKRKDALMEDLFSLLRIDSAMDMEHADAENPFGLVKKSIGCILEDC